MIDPIRITKFDRTDAELEECILFWIAAAGKNGVSAAKYVNRLLMGWNEGYLTPFDTIKRIDRISYLSLEMRRIGMGCYNRKARTFLDVSHSGINLRKCTREELIQFKGIKFKTANCFLLHSREGCRVAGLDTHMLKYLRDMGYKVPSRTPTSFRRYNEIEKYVFEIADRSGMALDALDQMVWNHYARHEKRPEIFTF